MSALAVVCGFILAGRNYSAEQVVPGGHVRSDRRSAERRADDDVRVGRTCLPDEVRSTGVGFVVAVGRVGNVLAATVANEAFNRGGNSGYFGSWSVLMGIVFVALALVSRTFRGAAVVEVRAGAAANR